MIGIYKITNLLTNEIYIGKGVEAEKRFVAHLKDFEHKRVQNKKLIQNMNEYGPTNFSFQIIELCERDQLDEREVYWIKHYNSFKEGLNMDEGGKTHKGNTNATGKHWNLSQEAKDNIGAGSRKAWTPERRKKYGESRKGVPKDYSNTDTSKMGKGTLGKHKVWDDKDKNIYHFE